MTRPDFTATRLPSLPRKPMPFVPFEERWPEHTATFTLDRQLADARKRIGEKRWAELQAEWPK